MPRTHVSLSLALAACLLLTGARVNLMAAESTLGTTEYVPANEMPGEAEHLGPSFTESDGYDSQSCGPDGCGLGGDSYADCCFDNCLDDCSGPGLVVGAEATFLRPHHSMGIRGADNTDLEYDFELAPRVWLGYQGPNGLGVRGRYWQFDQDVSGASIVAGRTDVNAFDTYLIDLEATDTAELGANWDLTVFGGVRYVDYVENRRSFVTATGATVNAHQFNFDGIGPTAGLELKCQLRDHWSLFGNLRSSILMGNENEFTGAALMLNDRELNNIRHITEIQLGVEWRRPLMCGGCVFARGAVEASEWNGFSGEPFFDGGEAVGFAGFSATLGMTR